MGFPVEQIYVRWSSYLSCFTGTTVLTMSANITPVVQQNEISANVTSRRELSELEKGKIIAYWECKLPVVKISQLVGRSWTTVKGFLIRYNNLQCIVACLIANVYRYEARGSHENIPRPGRPRTISPEQEEALVQFVKDNRTMENDMV